MSARCLVAEVTTCAARIKLAAHHPLGVCLAAPRVARDVWSCQGVAAGERRREGGGGSWWLVTYAQLSVL